MTGISALAMFCEDIRSEVGGGTTIVGILRDNLGIASFPWIFPKLGIYIRVNFPIHTDVGPINFYLRTSLGEVTQVGEVPLDGILSAQKQAKDEGALTAGIITTLVASPYNVSEPKRLSVELESGGIRQTIGWLNFQPMA